MQTSFRDDSWLGNTPIRVIFNMLYYISNHKKGKVDEIGILVDESMVYDKAGWDWYFGRWMYGLWFFMEEIFLSWTVFDRCSSSHYSSNYPFIREKIGVVCWDQWCTHYCICLCCPFLGDLIILLLTPLIVWSWLWMICGVARLPKMWWPFLGNFFKIRSLLEENCSKEGWFMIPLDFNCSFLCVACRIYLSFVCHM